MKSRNSLRFRVARAFTIFSAALSIAWALVVLSGVRLTEDRVLVRQLQLVAEDYALRFPDNGGELGPDTSFVRSYHDVEALPSALMEWATQTPEPGYYEFQQSELHVAVLSTGTPPRRLYLVFDVAGIEAASSEDWWWFGGLATVVTSLTMLATALGIVVSRQVVEPVTRLADIVGRIDPEKLSDDDWRRVQAGNFSNDEVGMLARTIEKALQRICAFVEREQYFTSAASHELRTPVTVMSGALELLEHSNMESRDARAVARIRRATDNMRTTIEMFLCLSRESRNGLYCEHFSVTPIVDLAIDNHRYLLENKNITVDLDFLSDPEIVGHPQAFAIAVNNLIRNAFEHTPREQGPITVRVNHHEVSVSNWSDLSSVDCNRPGTSQVRKSETRSYGLGLDIVRRICKQTGWIFLMRAHDDTVVASLSWQMQRKQPVDQILSTAT